MIKYQEDLPDGWTIGISGVGHTFTYLNSRLLLALLRGLGVEDSVFLVYCVRGLTFLLIFLEVYLVNSVASGTFYLAFRRFVLLSLLTVAWYYFGRKSLPYWSEPDEVSRD